MTTTSIQKTIAVGAAILGSMIASAGCNSKSSLDSSLPANPINIDDKSNSTSTKKEMEDSKNQNFRESFFNAQKGSSQTITEQYLFDSSQNNYGDTGTLDVNKQDLTIYGVELVEEENPLSIKQRSNSFSNASF